MLISLFTEQLREAKRLVQGYRAGICNSLGLPGAGVIRLNTCSQECEKWVRDSRAWQSNGTGQIVCCYCCCLFAQFCLFATPWIAEPQIPLSFTISWSLLRFMSMESVMLYLHYLLLFQSRSALSVGSCSSKASRFPSFPS